MCELPFLFFLPPSAFLLQKATPRAPFPVGLRLPVCRCGNSRCAPGFPFRLRGSMLASSGVFSAISAFPGSGSFLYPVDALPCYLRGPSEDVLQPLNFGSWVLFFLLFLVFFPLSTYQALRHILWPSVGIHRTSVPRNSVCIVDAGRPRYIWISRAHSACVSCLPATHCVLWSCAMRHGSIYHAAVG